MLLNNQCKVRDPTINSIVFVVVKTKNINKIGKNNLTPAVR